MKANGEIKSYIHLTSKIVYLSIKANSYGEEFFELECFNRKKIFSCDSTWPDLMSRFCISRNIITKKFGFLTQISKGNFSKIYLVENITTKQ